MIRGPKELWEKFDRRLVAEGIPRNRQGQYRKWLRFYLDFCHKYKHGYSDAGSLTPFLEKLKSKRQGSVRREQAGKAVAIYLRMVGDADRQRNEGGKVKAEGHGAGRGPGDGGQGELMVEEEGVWSQRWSCYN